MNRITIASAVRKVIDDMPVGTEFSGYELRERVLKIIPQANHAYVETFLKSIRKYRRRQVVCINNNRSIYKKVSNIEDEE